MLICLQSLDAVSIMDVMELDHVTSRHNLSEMAILILYLLENLEQPGANTSNPALR